MTAPQPVVHKDFLRINQSKIKRLTSPIICPQRYYLEDITGDLKRQSSEAMLRGQYFEYKVWGTLPKEGGIPVLKGGRKKGSISEPQKRIDAQVAAFPGIMQKHGIKVSKTDYFLEVLFNNEIIFYGTMDSLVEYRGKPYIMDLKLTADVTSTFGDFAWGNFQTLIMQPNATGVYSHVQTLADNGKEMDVIQAYAYMYLMKVLTKREWGFLYAVFDYKASGPEYKIIEIPHDDESRATMIERLKTTKHKMGLFQGMNYQAIPSLIECKSCKNEACPVRISVDDLQQQSADQQITEMLTLSVQERMKIDNDERPW